MPSSKEKDRRSPTERRKQERRRSMRYSVDTLIILDAVTWVDNEGSDRRRKIRRRDDREKIAKRILEEFDK
ncbi:MAG: hypothetical protein AB1631_01415 [Acidobacteriota bacterium]